MQTNFSKISQKMRKYLKDILSKSLKENFVNLSFNSFEKKFLINFVLKKIIFFIIKNSVKETACVILWNPKFTIFS